MNADENWITKATNILFATTYKVELEARSRLRLFIPLLGSVFMVRTNILKDLKFEHDITENYNLSVRMYLNGYKIVYDSAIDASGECPSRLHRVARQVARWAEGTTRNFRKYFWKVMRSNKLTMREKAEFMLSGLSYLSATLLVFAVIGGVVVTAMIDYVLSQPLTYISVMLATLGLPATMIMQSIAIAKEGEIRRLTWIPYALILGYLIAPVSAYYALKGLISNNGEFHRTYKTGHLVNRKSAEIRTYLEYPK
ncbi:MAG: glycosyltransferase family 2 protein [Aigarchaeota archaeon]|nr:glycosyltransferase family 2 protein [Candidatus Pelearchaeum maunauluense]